MSKEFLLAMFLQVAVFLSLVGPTLAQTSAGNITGIITDQSAAVLPNAKVTVTNQATGLKRETFTNNVGEYRVPLLPVGFYTIRVEVSGFKAQISKDLKLEIQQTARVDFKLELGDVRETVSVEAQAPLLETETTVTGSARPDRIADGNLPKEQQTLNRYWDVTAFVLPPTTNPRAGNGGRNILEGPGINNFDLGIFKTFQIREGFKAEFRYEMFNAFNHTQWGTPSANVENAATFGQITSTRDPRISQFVLKLVF